MKYLLIVVWVMTIYWARAQSPDFTQVGSEWYNRPVDIAHNDLENVLYIVEQEGRIYRLDLLTGDRYLWMDITDRVNSAGNEQGLLGMAFAPDYSTTRAFYLNYSDNTGGDTQVSRFYEHADGGVERGDPDVEESIIEVNQLFANHNGGCIKFGPDGYLYIGLGDGGAANDPTRVAQNPQELLGKMLRLSVSPDIEGYEIPSDNPFVGDSSARDEIWALGLRNPWRFSWDRVVGDLWIADVGQDRFEEINVWRAGDDTGANYGWRCREGKSPFRSDTECQGAVLIDPIYDYGHGDNGCSITGGFVARSDDAQQLWGDYIYADICSGKLWSLVGTETDPTPIELNPGFSINASTFGESSDGRLFVADIGGPVYEITTLNVSTEDLVNRPVTISPNPAHEVLFIFSEDWTGARYHIVDIGGRQIVPSAPLREARIDIRALSSGNYILYLQTDHAVGAVHFVKLD